MIRSSESLFTNWFMPSSARSRRSPLTHATPIPGQLHVGLSSWAEWIFTAHGLVADWANWTSPFLDLLVGTPVVARSKRFDHLTFHLSHRLKTSVTCSRVPTQNRDDTRSQSETTRALLQSP